jgi:hypothetical protein
MISLEAAAKAYKTLGVRDFSVVALIVILGWIAVSVKDDIKVHAQETRSDMRVLHQMNYAQCLNEADGIDYKKYRCDLAWQGKLGSGQ